MPEFGLQLTSSSKVFNLSTKMPQKISQQIFLQSSRLNQHNDTSTSLHSVSVSDIKTKIFLVKNRKSEIFYQIMNIQISLGITLQIKLLILIFWDKFTQIGYSRSKNTVNITIAFCIFQLI